MCFGFIINLDYLDGRIGVTGRKEGGLEGKLLAYAG